MIRPLGRGYPLRVRFLSRYVVDEQTGCWNWAGATYATGYARIVNDEGRPCRAHRVAYELFVGPIPPGLFVLHSCDNRICVNPAHLRCGTTTDNMRDKSERGRDPTAIFCEDDVRLIRSRSKSLTVLAREFDCSRSAICNVRQGRTYAWVEN